VQQLGHFTSRIETLARRLRQSAGLPSIGRISTTDVVSYLNQQGHCVDVMVGFEQLGHCDHVNAEVSAFSLRLEDRWVIVLNQTHPSTRRRVTLMEELVHIWLNHKPSTVSLNPFELERHRTYNSKQESEAYGVAAAALVPYEELRQKVLEQGLTKEAIAAYYEVSPRLVQYRMQITYIWRTLKSRRQI
jgi:Zn-dependent peptidase ImmA (M78 family)